MSIARFWRRQVQVELAAGGPRRSRRLPGRARHACRSQPLPPTRCAL